MPTPIRVLYIAGYGRSGSTVLELAAARHERVFAAGEVSLLFRELGRDGRCGCGEQVGRCDVWGPVAGAVRALVPGASWWALDEASRAHDMGPSGKRRAALYRAVWQAVFQEIASVSGAALVVDSSKTSWGAWLRPYRLATIPILDVRVVPLVRHPAAAASSRARGRNTDLAVGRRATGTAVTRRLWGYTGWTFATLVARRAAAALGGSEAVTFERFLDRPAEVVTQVLRAGGLDSPGALVRSGMPLDPGHSLAGNRLKRAGPIHLGRYDRGAQGSDRASTLARGLAALLWPDHGAAGPALGE